MASDDEALDKKKKTKAAKSAAGEELEQDTDSDAEPPKKAKQSRQKKTVKVTAEPQKEKEAAKVLKIAEAARQKKILAQEQREVEEVRAAERLREETKDAEDQGDSKTSEDDESAAVPAEKALEVGSAVRFHQSGRKVTEAVVRKISDKYVSVITKGGEKLKVPVDMMLQILPGGTGPKLLWHKGFEEDTVFKKARDAPLPMTEGMAAMDASDLEVLGIVHGVEGMVPSADSPEDPLPKWLQQMGKGHFILTPRIGELHPQSMDLAGIYRGLETVEEGQILTKIIVPLAYTIPYDQRSGKLQKGGCKIIAASLRAIKAYGAKPARIVVVDAATSAEWKGDGDMPLLVQNMPFKREEILFSRMDFIEGGRDELHNLMGAEAYLALEKGINTHPLFAHLRGEALTANGTNSVSHLLKLVGEDGPKGKEGRIALQKSCLSMLMKSIGKPIEVRYPAANGIDEKTKRAAGAEYLKTANQLAALLSKDNSDLSSIFRPTSSFEAHKDAAMEEHTPVLPDVPKPVAKVPAAKGKSPPPAQPPPPPPKPKAAPPLPKSHSAPPPPANKPATRKSSINLDGSPKKIDDEDEAPAPPKKKKSVDSNDMDVSNYEGIASAVASIPQIELQLREAVRELASREQSMLLKMQDEGTKKDERIAQLTLERERDVQAAETKLAAYISRESELQKSLMAEVAKSAKFEAEAAQLREMLQTTAAQVSMWHEMFKDLQDRRAFRILHENRRHHQDENRPPG